FKDTVTGSAAIEEGLRTVLAEAQPDLIHIQHLMGYPLAAVKKILAEYGRPIVITLHDFWWVCANAQLITNYSQELCEGPNYHLNCGRCVVARAQRPILAPLIPGFALLLRQRAQQLKGILRLAIHIVTPTRFVADWYRSKLDMLTLPFAVENGIVLPAEAELNHPADLPNWPQEVRLENSSRPLEIAYLGGLDFQKGIGTLIEAVRPHTDQLRLHIAGSKGREPTFAESTLANLPPNAVYHGRLDRRQIWHLLQKADILAVPSLWYETFGLVVSEAFAVGTPPVVSNLGALAERVEHMVDGITCPPGDQYAWQKMLLHLANRRALLEKMRKQRRQVTSIDAHREAIMRIYQRPPTKYFPNN
ncbi:MAG: glycosyltransferase, partial [Chloroflexota bacterium]